jgi:hypothetical protein
MRPAASAPRPPTKAPIPAVAMAPAACDEELVAAAAVPLPDAALEVEDPEWSWS